MDSYKARLDRAKKLGFGEGTTIYHSSLVIGNVKVGKNVWIGPFTVLDGSGDLEIGDNCSISAGVQIYTHDTVKKRLSNCKIAGEKAKTKIGNSCYIGPLVIIVKGVTVGNFVVVGAHSFVNKNVPSHSIIFGAPAKVYANVKQKYSEIFDG